MPAIETGVGAQPSGGVLNARCPLEDGDQHPQLLGNPVYGFSSHIVGFDNFLRYITTTAPRTTSRRGPWCTHSNLHTSGQCGSTRWCFSSPHSDRSGLGMSQIDFLCAEAANGRDLPTATLIANNFDSRSPRVARHGIAVSDRMSS